MLQQRIGWCLCGEGGSVRVAAILWDLAVAVVVLLKMMVYWWFIGDERWWWWWVLVVVK